MVEQVQIAQYLMKGMLHCLGFSECLFLNNRRELEKAIHNINAPFDLLILNKEGFDHYTRILTNSHYHAIPVIIISNNINCSDYPKTFCLTIPFHINELKDALEHLQIKIS